MKRREFINSALAGGILLTGNRSAAPRAAQSKLADARIEILPDEPIGRIAPEIYGHFAEELGHGIDGGIWVGEDSPIPNIHGYRRDVVEALQKLHVPVVRWPGG